ncbi:aminoglycoside 6-adenylyltransferase [Pseudalkalibacillus salsuginis]|uniref:aminoglycoside 6-adenylyltransferase n=1 Tax=Pseudalkalibacillus salsuginis TaxID=2910972 RepID=UPI001F293A6F|nr:aminoglycoside 6-adenylyltransferase [Pseudalkalibacillus salsuginis]MCF6409881.1 aminoglycoside 6-adenylyltransferase [Pseudalkalibacillus salsuginis]
MRTEKEMMDLILSKAERDERIRAVVLNGSRANPNVKRDIFQDYDIVYLVNDIASFTDDHSWVDYFGERIMMQMPEEKVLPLANDDGRFPYLMQFIDGNRIDLTLISINKIDELNWESLSIPLLDKDDLVSDLPPSDDRDFHIKRPGKKEYEDTCNEFWWICLNISKGLWREELSYVMFMYEQVNRNVLIRMVEWDIGIQTNFSKSSGKFGKYFRDFLNDEDWDQFVVTYPGPGYDRIWDALFAMCDLFRKKAISVADYFSYDYPYEDDQKVSAYLRRVQHLPKGSETQGL